MFRLADPDALWPCRVPVPVPTEDGGTEDRWFTARFRAISASRLEELSGEGDAPLLRAVLAGWEEIADADGAPLAFTPAPLDLLLDVLAWRFATARAYVAWLRGHPAKNSGAPPVIS